MDSVKCHEPQDRCGETRQAEEMLRKCDSQQCGC